MPARNDLLKDPSKKPLSSKQQSFLNNLVYHNMSQREAYLAAGYSGKNSKAVIDKNACELLKKSNVAVRYNQMTDELRQQDKEKAIWTRDMAIQENKTMIELANLEITRILESVDKEIKEKQLELDAALDAGDIKESRKIRDEIKLLERYPISRAAVTAQKRGAIDSLNKIMGFEKQVVEMEANINFTGDNELKD